MTIIAKIFEFVGSLGARAKDNKNTTIGGGIGGVALAALIGQLETATGCHFKEAFMGIDWMQIIGYVLVQTFGAISTDAKKTV